MEQQEHLHELLAFAKQITIDAGDYIVQTLKQQEIRVQFKTSSTDLVTQVDQETERRLVSRIQAKYPDHTIIGEEGISTPDLAKPYRWYIDPIDGTTNFVHQQVNFCISVSLYKEGEGLIGIVYDPMRREMFWAAKGLGAYLNESPLATLEEKHLKDALIGTNLLWVRRTRTWGIDQEVFEIAKRSRGIRSLGAAALELAYVAAGRLDGFLSLHLSPWDYAAGKVLITEVGGCITDFRGRELPFTKDKYGLLAANQKVHEEMLHLLKQKGE